MVPLDGREYANIASLPRGDFNLSSPAISSSTWMVWAAKLLGLSQVSGGMTATIRRRGSVGGRHVAGRERGGRA